MRQLVNPNDNGDETSASMSLVLSAPINGRITNMLPFRHPSSDTDYLFFITETKQYAVISYAPNQNTNDAAQDRDVDSTAPYNLRTHVSGDLSNYGLAIRGNEPEGGPVAALDPSNKCIALHLYEGFITILPIHKDYRYNPNAIASTMTSNRTTGTGRRSSSSNNTIKPSWDFLGPPFHNRIEERDVFHITFLIPKKDREEKIMPQVALLHQDSRGNQHVIAHSVDLAEKNLIMHGLVSPVGTNMSFSSKPISAPLVQHRLKKSRVDGSSGLIVPVPPVEDCGDKKMSAGATASAMSSSPSTMDDVDQGSPTGGIIILGQKQLTYHDTALNLTKILPIAESIMTSFVHVYPISSDESGSTMSGQDVVRYLLGGEDGRMYILAVARTMDGKVTGMHIDTLGVTNISSSLVYLEKGIVFVGSQTTDSQLIQVLDEPVPIPASSNDPISNHGSLINGKNVTYINVLEEYTNLGPIVDFDLVPTCHNSFGLTNTGNRQVMAVTASGTEKDGTIRLVRNGIGMTEHAAVELGGINGMWNIRKKFHDQDDSFLIQSYVGETRILGVVSDDEDDDDEVIEDVSGDNEEGDASDSGATLTEVNIAGLDSGRTTLFAGNVHVDGSIDTSLMVQITPAEIRLISIEGSKCLEEWTPSDNAFITVASANEAGQIAVAVRGGHLWYFQVAVSGSNFELECVGQSKVGKEISCIDLNPFDSDDVVKAGAGDMDVDREDASPKAVVKSEILAIGLWDESFVQLLSLDKSNPLASLLSVDMGSNETSKSDNINDNLGQQMMARSLCLVTLDSSSSHASSRTQEGQDSSGSKLNMLLIGLGDGSLLSFVVDKGEGGKKISVTSRKEVSIGTRALKLVPFDNHAADKGTCVLATGDRPTVIYLSGGSNGSSRNARLCYSNIHLSTDADDFEEDTSVPSTFNDPLVVNVASPFHSSLLFDAPYVSGREGYYSLCISDDAILRLGLIDDIQKLHVTSHKLGMPPRRVTYDESSRLVCVGCIDNNLNNNRNASVGGEINMGNSVRFFDAISFEEVDSFYLGPYETIMSMISTRMLITNDISGEQKEAGQESYQPFLVIGTAYGIPGEHEPSRGRIIVLKCTTGNNDNSLSRKVKQVAEVQVKGGVFSLCPFYNGSILATINSKTRMCKLVGEGDMIDLKIIGAGHHGHIMSLFVRSLADGDNSASANREQLAIVGDMVRSISVVKYYPEYETLEEIARDFNQNWVTAIEMLTNDVYLGAENFHNIFALQRNPHSLSEEIRCRLDTVGLYNLGEMINKFMRGSLVMANNSSLTSMNVAKESIGGDDSMDDGTESESRKLTLSIGTQTLYATVDGSIGSVIGLDASSAAFFTALQRAMTRIVNPVGDLKHDAFRSYRGQRNHQASRGFIDGDLIESFPELDPAIMDLIVKDMNNERRWDISELKKQQARSKNPSQDMMDTEKRRDLTVGEIMAMVENMSMAH